VTLSFRPRRIGVVRGTIKVGTDDPAARSISLVVTGTGRT
jgi:hypothetical protein